MLCAAAKMQKRTAPTFINPCKTKRAALGFFITRAPFLARLGQKRNSEKSGASPLRLSKKEEAMPKESHTKAEDHHESAAKSHRMAAAGFDTLGFSTCQSRRSAIVRQIKINDLSAPYNGKMLSSSQLLN
jgi:hypothetical protein